MAAIPPEIERRVGTVLAERYKLLRVLGVGGMGAVFEAEQSLLARHVAVKVMLRETEPDSVAAQRFLQEAQAAARIVHPNVVAVLDVGHDAMNQTLYIVHEYLTGVDLRKRLASGPLSPREAIELLAPVIAALVALHRRGIVHRDIKPENIFFAETDGHGVVPKLIDFGVSKLLDDKADHSLTRTGHLVGTPQYMSPEQARGERRIDAATDVWSIGAVLYEAMSGRCPFTADNYNALMLAILTVEPPRLDEIAPDVPPSLARVVHAALTRDRASRPSAADLLASLLSCEGFASEPWRARLAATYEGVTARSDSPSAMGSDALDAPTLDPVAVADTPAAVDPIALAPTLGARPRRGPEVTARGVVTSRAILLGAFAFATVTLGAIGWRMSARRAVVARVDAQPVATSEYERVSDATTSDVSEPDVTTRAVVIDAGVIDAGVIDAVAIDASARETEVRRATTRPASRPRPRPANGIPIL